jgi:hypothetical protein
VSQIAVTVDVQERVEQRVETLLAGDIHRQRQKPRTPNKVNIALPAQLPAGRRTAPIRQRGRIPYGTSMRSNTIQLKEYIFVPGHSC